MCFVGDKEAEEGRRLGPTVTVHCEMRAHYKASVEKTATLKLLSVDWAVGRQK